MHIASLLLGFMSSVTGSTWAGAFSARHWPTAHFGPSSAYCPVPPFTGLRHSCAPWPCDLCAVPACLGHWHLCPGTTVPPLFLGIRVGEAQHPGPLPSAAAPVLRLGACNPTGLNGKHGLVAELPADVYAVSESHLTRRGLGLFRAGLRMMNSDLRFVSGPPVAPRARSTVTGQYSGVGFLSSVPARAAPHSVAAELVATSRIKAAKRGELSVETLDLPERVRLFRQQVRALMAQTGGFLQAADVRPYSATLLVKLPSAYLPWSQDEFDLLERHFASALEAGACLQTRRLSPFFRLWPPSAVLPLLPSSTVPRKVQKGFRDLGRRA